MSTEYDKDHRTLEARFTDGLKAVTRGVSFLRSRGAVEAEPIELRVQNITGAIMHTALVKLLLKAKVIDRDELVEAVALEAAAEQKRYEKAIVDLTGRNKCDLSADIV